MPSQGPFIPGAPRYQPWAHSYFSTIQRRLSALAVAPPLAGHAHAEYAVIERRATSLHTLDALRHAEGELFLLKVSWLPEPFRQGAYCATALELFCNAAHHELILRRMRRAASLAASA
jgi:hypothetical protein